MSHSPADPADVLAQVLADPNTEVIAQSLGLSVDEYARQVVHFILHPTQPPHVMVLSAAALQSRGQTPIDPKEVLAYVTQSAEMAGERSGFTQPSKPKVTLDQVRVGEGVDVAKADPKLKDDVAQQLRKNRNKKG